MGDYKKLPPEYPRRMRHYFHVDLPEELRKSSENINNAWIDVRVDYGPNEIGHNIEIMDWGVVFDGVCIQPTWCSQQLIEDQKSKVCLK